MDENEYKMILGVYQKKTHEMLAQIIALETRVLRAFAVARYSTTSPRAR